MNLEYRITTNNYVIRFLEARALSKVAGYLEPQRTRSLLCAFSLPGNSARVPVDVDKMQTHWLSWFIQIKS